MQMKFTWKWLALLALTVAHSTQAGVYKWVDKDGSVHFGDQPPADVKQKAEVKPAPKGIAAPASAAQTGAQDAEFRKRRIDRAEQEKKAEAAEQAKSDKAERCRKMKTSVDEMQSGFRIYDYDKNGQRYYLDDKQAEKAKADAKAAYAKDCQ